MKKLIITYGLIGGVVCSVLGILNWFLIAPYSGPGISQFIGYLAVVLSLVCVPLAIIYFRNKQNQGLVTFGQGFKIGLGVTVITAFIVGLYSYLFFVFAGESFDQWRTEGLSDRELQAMQTKMDQMPAFTQSHWFLGLILFINVCLIGLVISILSSLLLKRTK